MDEIHSSYDLREDDSQVLFQIKESLETLQKDYKILIGHTKNKAFAYTKVVKELGVLVKNLTQIEENLDNESS